MSQAVLITTILLTVAYLGVAAYFGLARLLTHGIVPKVREGLLRITVLAMLLVVILLSWYSLQAMPTQVYTEQYFDNATNKTIIVSRVLYGENPYAPLLLIPLVVNVASLVLNSLLLLLAYIRTI